MCVCVFFYVTGSESEHVDVMTALTIAVFCVL